MSQDQIMDWYAYHSLYSIDESYNSDLRNAQSCSILWNTNCAKGNGKSLIDFMPRYKPVKEELTDEQIKNKAMAMFGNSQKKSKTAKKTNK